MRVLAFTVVDIERVRLQYVSIISTCSIAQSCGNSGTHHKRQLLSTKLTLTLQPGEKNTNLRVALDRILIAVGDDGFCLCHVALEEGVAEGVGMLGGADVSVEGVGGRADRQLLWSHWLSCWDDSAV